MIKKLSIILGVLVSLVIGGVLLLPVLVPVESVVAKVREHVKAETGRDMNFEGVAFVFWPDIGVSLNNVTFSNPGWAKEKNMLVLGKADVALALKPLLRHRIKIKRFILEEPSVYLEVAADGKKSWDFSKKESSADGGEPATVSAAGSAKDFSFSFGQLRIRKGHLVFADGKSGSASRIDDVNMDVIFPDLKSSVQMKGDLTYRKKRVDLAFSLEKPVDFMQGSTSPGQMTLKTEDVSMKAGGAFALRGEMLNGNVEADVPSPAGVMAWLGGGTEKNFPFEKIAFASTMQMSRTDMVLKSADLTLDDIHAKGNVNVGFGGKPALFARLSLGKLNLDRFTGGVKTAKDAAEDEGENKKEGWDASPFDLRALKSVNADMELKTEGFSLRGISAGPSVLTVLLQDGKLDFKSSEAGLLGGRFKSDLGLNAAASPPSLNFSLDVKDVQAKPLLSTFAHFKKLSGAANGHVEGASSGGSQKSMISGLHGKGSLQFKKGALEGIDLAGIARLIQKRQTDVGGIGEGKTEFTELEGTFTVSGGVIENNDMKMAGPLLHATGKGTISLTDRYVRYRVLPVLKTSAKEGAAGLSIPVDIKGPFNAIKAKPDFSAVVEKAVQNPRALFKELKENPLKALKNLLKTGGAPEQTKEAVPPASGTAPSPEAAPPAIVVPAPVPAPAAPAPVPGVVP